MTSEEREVLRLGREQFERGDADGVLRHLGRIVSTCNGFADVHYMLGVAHDQHGDLDAAAASLEAALAINPGYAEATLALSSVYERQGRFERSRELAESTRQHVQTTGDSLDATTRGKLANLHAALGDAYREAGEYREAVESYRKALDRCPDFHDIRHRLGVVLRDAGRPDQAMREFQRVLRAHPGNLDSAVQLGLTQYTLGRCDEAVEQWKAVAARDASNRDAQMYLRLIGPPVGPRTR